MTDTLQLCPHGAPVKFNNCRYCFPPNELLEEEIRILKDRQKYLEEHWNKIHKLEKNLEHHSNWLNNIQEDVVNYISRVVEVEKEINRFSKWLYSTGDISAIHGQIDNISANDKFNDHRIEKLEKEITEIFRVLDEQGTLMRHENLSPYKCPVCEGEGKNKTKFQMVPFEGTINKLIMVDCHACDGKGVLWK